MIYKHHLINQRIIKITKMIKIIIYTNHQQLKIITNNRIINQIQQRRNRLVAILVVQSMK